MSKEAKEKLALAFQEVDRDHSGSIDAQELEKVLGSYYSACGKPADKARLKKETQEFLKVVDKNHDNKISKDEFIQYFLQYC